MNPNMHAGRRSQKDNAQNDCADVDNDNKKGYEDDWMLM